MRRFCAARRDEADLASPANGWYANRVRLALSTPQSVPAQDEHNN
jgi:hypothetical protein